jgi:hypothetical protein
MGEIAMKITVVGAAIIIAVVVGLILLLRFLFGGNGQGPQEGDNK